jgi:hypothetical protein
MNSWCAAALQREEAADHHAIREKKAPLRALLHSPPG